MPTLPANLFSSTDHALMQQALRVAEFGLGLTWPNPSVGCVIAKNCHVVGIGATAAGGRPHAEIMALQQAGALAQGADVYVTLEPCAHIGQTPPCAMALIEAGVKRVVIATADPYPQVAGRGIMLLQQAGIVVEVGLCAAEAQHSHAGFFSLVQRQRPLLALKIAASLDGKIALKNGQSKWITSPAARERAHWLRSHYDAIMVGINTVLADDPMLNSRLQGLERRRNPRIVVDTHLRLPLNAQLVETAALFPVWVFCGKAAQASAHAQSLQAKNVRVFGVDVEPNGHVDLAEILAILGKEGISRLLLEGGIKLATGFWQQGLVDELYWFQAPLLMGAGAIDATPVAQIFTMADAQRLSQAKVLWQHPTIMGEMLLYSQLQ
ncbi:MAG: bifunctional diaminohydroxyphosphoribosylaminopyrimidine deaminase/5-amino-6-(5-phosphoribosylamino)uracil reductase RibD [Alphaproteobacteria bacterium]